MALIIAPELYSRPPVDPVPGARWDFRKFAITAAQGVINNIIALMPLPAYCRPYLCMLECSDLDSGGSTIVLDVGILNSYYNKPVASAIYPGGVDVNGQLDGATITALDTGVTPALVSGKNLITSSGAGGAGTRTLDGTLAYGLAIGVSKWTRIIAVKITTAATTPAAGTIALGVMLDADQYDS